MLKVYSVSLGCPKNRVDTERLLGSLGPVTTVAQPQDADLVFINTCGFIRPAIEESVRTVLELAAGVADASGRPFVAVGGCLVGRFGADEFVKEIPEVDLWLDNRELARWPELLGNALGLEPVPGRMLSTGPSYAYLKLSDGCDHACSFCTIPSIRGKLRSFPEAALVEEARTLVSGGVKELALVAQDLTAYGRDRGERGGLRALLEKLLRLDGLRWIRLMYLYPAGLDRDFLNFARDAGRASSGPRLLPYFDVPMQHAHPDILSRMGRPFARNPQETVDRIRDVLPHAALRTSMIVGFPGETEKHFECLTAFVEKNRFHHLGVFAYEPEDGTEAARMPGRIGQKVKNERRDAVMAVQAEISREILSECQGSRMEVLVDSAHGEWPGLHTGRVWFQAPEVDGVTYVSGPGVAPGAMVDADVMESAEYDLTALA